MCVFTLAWLSPCYVIVGLFESVCLRQLGLFSYEAYEYWLWLVGGVLPHNCTCGNCPIRPLLVRADLFVSRGVPTHLLWSCLWMQLPQLRLAKFLRCATTRWNTVCECHLLNVFAKPEWDSHAISLWNFMYVTSSSHQFFKWSCWFAVTTAS